MAHACARLAPEARRVARRLAIAVGVSAWLHALLIVGLPVDPHGGGVGDAVVISARLVPGSAEPDSPLTDAPPPRTVTDVPAVEPRPQQPAAPAREAGTQPPQVASARPGLDLPLARDPTYYPARLLDVYPTPLAEIRFSYPSSADADRASGLVRMQLLIDEAGLIDELTVVDAAPPGYFEEAAREGLRRVRFSPGMREGRAVKSRVVIQVRFEYGVDGAVAR